MEKIDVIIMTRKMLFGNPSMFLAIGKDYNLINAVSHRPDLISRTKCKLKIPKNNPKK